MCVMHCYCRSSVDLRRYSETISLSGPDRRPEMNTFTLSGKTALITGGASGIGSAVVELFNNLGASICVVDLQVSATTMPNMHVLQGDVSSEDDTIRVTQNAIAHMGSVDVLVNCAGIPDTYTPTLQQDVS